MLRVVATTLCYIFKRSGATAVVIFSFFELTLVIISSTLKIQKQYYTTEFNRIMIFAKPFASTTSNLESTIPQNDISSILKHDPPTHHSQGEVVEEIIRALGL